MGKRSGWLLVSHYSASGYSTQQLTWNCTFGPFPRGKSSYRVHTRFSGSWPMVGEAVAPFGFHPLHPRRCQRPRTAQRLELGLGFGGGVEGLAFSAETLPEGVSEPF